MIAAIEVILVGHLETMMALSSNVIKPCMSCNYFEGTILASIIAAIAFFCICVSCLLTVVLYHLLGSTVKQFADVTTP